MGGGNDTRPAGWPLEGPKAQGVIIPRVPLSLEGASGGLGANSIARAAGAQGTKHDFMRRRRLSAVADRAPAACEAYSPNERIKSVLFPARGGERKRSVERGVTTLSLEGLARPLAKRARTA